MTHKKDTKIVILAGGYGSRLSEETSVRPKPMVKIGQHPILWHIMKLYSYYGFNDFVILLGYKGYMIKEYFFNYALHQSDVTIDMSNNTMTTHSKTAEPWTITLVDTGQDTMTGGRIKRAAEYIGNKRFMLTYGDGLCDIDINQLLEFHESSKSIMTMTTVKPSGKYGVVDISNNQVINFIEKPQDDMSWINGGFFVCEPEVLNYISDDSDVFEEGPIQNIMSDNRLSAFKHNGYWGCMDTMKDKFLMNEIWGQGNAPWKKY